MRCFAVKLGLNIDAQFIGRVEGKGPVPLEACFVETANLPIGIAKMIIDGRIVGFEFNRLFKLFNGILVSGDFIINPAKTIDDITVFGLNSTAR